MDFAPDTGKPVKRGPRQAEPKPSKVKQAAAQVVRATTPAGALDWEGPAEAGGRAVTQRVHMTSQHWECDVWRRKPARRNFAAAGDAQFERRMGGAAPEIGSSRDLLARFGPAGDWSTVDQTGDVALRDPDRNAHADAAHYDRLADSVALSGSVELSDSNSITTAQSATLQRSTNEFHAQGRVVTIEIASGTSATNFAPGPARISADHLDANTATGHSVYSKNARLWQGDSVVEAETIELDQATHVLTANGRVRAIFPQAQLRSLPAARRAAHPTTSRQFPRMTFGTPRPTA